MMAKYTVRKREEPPPKRRRSLGAILMSQAPGIVGLGSIAAALGYVWFAKTFPPHILYFAPVEVLVAVGFVSLGIWAFSS